MGNLKYIFLQLLCLSFVLTGCDNYLDIQPKGRQLLTTVGDFDKWLNSQTLTIESQQNILNYMTDNYDNAGISSTPATLVELIYTWQPQFTANVTDPTYLWGDHYQRINLFNTVISGIDEATEGTAAQKRSLKAEALLGRANSYFYLVNEYAKPYNAETAGTDLAVPFVTSDNVSQKTPPRSTVAEIYRHIIDDITTAIPDLPNDNSNARFRGSKAAAYSVLARVYFYRREYTEAQRYAELALANTKAVMIDYTAPATFPTTTNVVSHPDVIYGRASVAAGIPADLNLMRMFPANDRRPQVLYYSSDRYTYTTRGATMFYAAAVTPAFQLTNMGTSVQEMRLIAAECAARSNQLTVALDHLYEVQRFRRTNHVKYTSTVQEDVLQEVLNERRRELPFHGLRWFDMRRLDSENRMPAVERKDKDGNVVFTLEPHSDKYTLQIPVQVLAFNPDMIVNPR